MVLVPHNTMKRLWTISSGSMPVPQPMVDDMPAAAYFSPPLTTMRLDFRALGIATFKMLHHQIVSGEPAQHYVVEPELVIRESTARIARR